jgi:Bacterial Ig-like domain (group 3)/FG-GAP-like repeat
MRYARVDLGLAAKGISVLFSTMGRPSGGFRKAARRALVIAIAMVLLHSLGGTAGAQAGVFDRKELTSIIQKLLKEASDDCNQYKNDYDIDRCTRGYLAYIFYLSHGGNVVKGFRPEARGVAHATGTPALSLNSSTPSLPFLGNPLVGLSYVPNATVPADVTAAYAIALRRNPDCSLDEDLNVPNATSLSDIYFTSFPSAQDYFHKLSGLTTTPDVFKNGCTDPVLGVAATGNILALGSTSNGSPITAELANAGLYASVSDFTANKITNTQVSNSQTAGYFSAASLRNNGIMDLVETGLTDPANQQPATAVFLGNGDGTFRAAVYYDVSDTSGSVAGLTIDDVNGDGIPDIVVPKTTGITNPGVPTFTGSVTTLIGKGDGSFTTGPVSSVTWTDSLLPITGDFNGDGKKDLLIGGTVLFGAGDGTFTTGPTNTALAAAANSDVQAGAVGDLSNNGKLDVVVSQPGTVAIFTGNGDGTFQTGPVYAGLPDYEQVTITDIDGDGNPDIFLGTSTDGIYVNGGYDMEFPMWQILMGRGDGTFVDSAVYQQGTYNLPGSSNTNNSLQMASADFNGDSKADVLVLDRNYVGTSPSSLLVLPGDGKGNLGAPITSSINLTPTMVVVADMNHDQKPDAVMIGPGIDANPKVSVLINQGNGTFTAEQDYTIGAANSLAVGDFNGDGFMDVAVSEGSAGVFVLLGQSNGTLGTAKQIDTSNAVDVVAGSLTADGRTDLIVVDGGVAGGQAGALLVYLCNADGSFTPATAPTTSATTYSVAALGDLNHDGKLDLIVAGGVAGTNGNPGTLNAYTLLGNGDGTFQAANTLPLTDVTATSIALADFNKDGNLDVTLGDRNYYTEVLLGHGDGTLDEGLIALGQRPATVGTADLLGNGYPELLVGLPTGALTVFVNSAVWNSSSTPPALVATTTALTASAATITAGASVTFTATVSGPSGNTTVPTGTVTFMEGTTTLGTGTLSATGVATYATTALPTGSDSITAVYGGDSSFSGSTSSAVTVTVNAVVVNPSFALSNSGNITVAPGATSGNTSKISVAGSGGFSAAVALTCAVTPVAASDPAACSLSPTSVTISGATTQTSTLTITTTAAAASSQRVDPKSGGVPWYAAAGATLACVLLCGIPVRRRGWQNLLGMLILLACLATVLTGCGGGGSSSGGGNSSGGGGGSSTGNPGTTAATYTVTVTGTSGTTVETSTVTVTVN